MKIISKKDVPKNISDLLNKRETFRKKADFTNADRIRLQVEKEGFIIQDTPKGVMILKEIKNKKKENFLVLFGSGETSSIGGQIHEKVIKAIGIDKPNISLISTPAGFQPNVESVYQEIADFFRVRLQNYHPEINIIFANTRLDANNENIVKPIESADYIFTGPGSPTYAVKQLKDTLLYRKLIERISYGATLCIASAATISFSRYVLPVYEIYKVGESLHWQRGLDLYSLFNLPVSVIPHFDNKEGGEKLDTSRCFIGKDRFEKMLKILPVKEKIWGIDENTALIINLKNEKLEVKGLGKLTKIEPS